MHENEGRKGGGRCENAGRRGKKGDGRHLGESGKCAEIVFFAFLGDISY